MFSRLLSLTRYTILIPVIGAWIAALIALGLGGFEVIQTILMLFNNGAGLSGDKGLKLLLLNLVEGVDLFLLGTAFYLISLGLYELFVDPHIEVPGWLEIHDLDDLKNKLLGVVVVVLSVQFLAQVLSWNGQLDLLNFGAAIGVVIASLAFFIGQKGKKNGKT